MLELFFFSHSPELNPDEWVWKSVKHDHHSADSSGT